MVKRIQLEWPTDMDLKPVLDPREFPREYVDAVFGHVSRGDYLTFGGTAPKIHRDCPVRQALIAALYADPGRLRAACAEAYAARFREFSQGLPDEELPV